MPIPLSPRTSLVLAFALLGVSVAPALAAEATTRPAVRLSAQFSDHMVVQRDVPVPIWGEAAPGAQVTVAFAGTSMTATADDDGRWRATLPAMAASAESRELTISTDGQTTRIKDVLVGEVWLCSGQSNMAYRIGKLPAAEKDIAAADDPLLRTFNVDQRPAERPQSFVRDSTWTVTKPGVAGEWSAFAFYFARKLRAELNVPVGILLPAWGGSSVAAWMGPDAFAREPLRSTMPDDLIGWRQNVQPYRLYNGMLAPLAPYALKGMVWYQGETEGTEYQGAYRNAFLYRELFPQMIADWRHAWGRRDVPFYWVQLPNLANPKLNWPVVRESQALSQRVPNTGMVPAIDLGDDRDLHPKEKRALAERMADYVLAKQYGMDRPSEFVQLDRATVEGSSMRITFKGATVALKTTDDKPPRAFQVAGADGKYHDAEATIEGASVVVRSSSVPKPATVRYAWAGAPNANLVNSAGLPTVPFRTDSLPVVGSEMAWRELPKKATLGAETNGGELANGAAGWKATSDDGVDAAKLLKDETYFRLSPRTLAFLVMDKPTRGRTDSPQMSWTTVGPNPAETFDAAKGATAEVSIQPSAVGHPLLGFDLEIGLKRADGAFVRYFISAAPARLNAFRHNELWKVRNDLDNSRTRGTYRLAIRPDGVAQVYLNGERIALLPGDVVAGAPKDAKPYVRIGKSADSGEFLVTLIGVGLDAGGAYAP